MFLFSSPQLHHPLFLKNRYEGDNFVLDQQVVRSALKSLNSLMSPPSASSENLPDSSRYLRFLLNPRPVSISDSDSSSSWDNPDKPILLLEWRAAVLVRDHALNVQKGELDGTMNQRVSKAVTEAFVAVQIGEAIRDLPDGSDSEVLRSLHLLVSLSNVLLCNCEHVFFIVLADDRRICARGFSWFWAP